MKRLLLTNFSVKHPWLIISLVVIITVLFGSQFPKVQFDNDPENMLSEDEWVRVFHHEVKEKFNLYDFVIVGIVNEEDPNGVFNVKTLGHIHDLTSQLLSLHQNEEGLPEVVIDADSLERKSLDLSSKSAFKRAMAVVFSHDPNHLFDEEGHSAIIAEEVISPSVVDNIKQADQGSLKMEYLMENAPQTREEALVIRNDAMGNPLYKGTLVAEDEKAICIYIPIIAKPYSYNVANLVQELTKDWEGNDKVYVTGLPVAEDTFGVEMLVQMAISAPLAMLILFLLMYMFFRRVSLIIAPLLLAIVTVIWTMGLLIGMGFDVHIMSSMIPIFIMPITVCNSIHLLSEFFDSYARYNDKVKTLRHVVGDLFMPMLYATTTTIAGFASLATTPIPPVRVFGLFVAFGVAAGWLLTMTFVPAFITLFNSQKSLHKLCAVPEEKNEKAREVRLTLLDRFLRWLGVASYRGAKWVIVFAVLVLAFSIYGIMLIRVNDNPVKWFTAEHPIRVADQVLNDHFGGTYTAYLTFTASPDNLLTCREAAPLIRAEAEKRFAAKFPEASRDFLAQLDKTSEKFCQVTTCDPDRCFVAMVQAAEKADQQAGSSWNNLADEINYLDPETLTFASLLEQVSQQKGVKDAVKKVFTANIQPFKNLSGMALLEKALGICDEFTALTFSEFVFEMKTELLAPAFKRPEVLAYLATVQDHLLSIGVVGKTSSAVDAQEKAAYELNYQAIPADATAAERAIIEKRNESYFSIPDSAAAIGQVFIQLEGMKKKDTLFHLLTKDYQEANVWVQLKSGDNQDMAAVIEDLDTYLAANPPPVKMDIKWAGLTYLNVIWQEKMVNGMMLSLASSFVVVLVMMLILFRSGLFGILAMIPLTVTITFIYGLIGWIGKDYDMPVAILSAMTLGLSVDFAIHFLERAREIRKKTKNWQEANTKMFEEPARAISRNAIVIAFGFFPLLLAPLVPYRTVGFFLALIMLISWMATLLILPALIKLLEKRLFKTK